MRECSRLNCFLSQDLRVVLAPFGSDVVASLFLPSGGESRGQAVEVPPGGQTSRGSDLVASLFFQGVRPSRKFILAISRGQT